MIIFGIDPGTAKTGYAVVKTNGVDKRPFLIDVGCITTLPEEDMHFRLGILYKSLLDLGEKHRPDVMVIEKLFFNTNAKTAISVGQARGVSLLVAANSQKKMEVFEYTALQAKLVVTGYGRADKKEMQEALKKYMGLKEVIKPDDATDAVAIVLCYLDKDFKGTKSKAKNED